MKIYMKVIALFGRLTFACLLLVSPWDALDLHPRGPDEGLEVEGDPHS